MEGLKNHSGFGLFPMQLKSLCQLVNLVTMSYFYLSSNETVVKLMFSIAFNIAA